MIPPLLYFSFHVSLGLIAVSLSFPTVFSFVLASHAPGSQRNFLYCDIIPCIAITRKVEVDLTVNRSGRVSFDP
jgi:hypothetical protein